MQRLNREGVEAVKRHDYEKAEALFLKAYLYDPADPFTLNNLGYISELQGQLIAPTSSIKLAVGTRLQRGHRREQLQESRRESR